MVTISPGQAMLILISHLKKNPHNENDIEFLKKAYLAGISPDNHESLTRLNELIEANPALFSKYEISNELKVIDEDSSRRYFETHLAYHSLKDQKALSLSTLQAHCLQLKQILPDVKEQYTDMLYGRKPFTSEKIIPEYANAIQRVDTLEAFKDFTPEDKEKIKLLLESAFWPVQFLQEKNSIFPLNIYNTGIYTKKSRGKGEFFKPYQGVHSPHLGIIKSYMPVPRSDIASSEEKMKVDRAPDRSAIVDKKAEWVEYSFSSLVNPFVNSISGTILCQLRALKYFHDNGSLTLFDLTGLVKGLISSCMYMLGGHSLFEFFQVLQIPEIQSAFSFMPNFRELTSINLYYEQNTSAFNMALDEAIDYNKQILARAEMHAEIKARVNRDLKTEDKETKRGKEPERKIIFSNVSSAFAKNALPPGTSIYFIDVEIDENNKKFIFNFKKADGSSVHQLVEFEKIGDYLLLTFGDKDEVTKKRLYHDSILQPALLNKIVDEKKNSQLTWVLQHCPIKETLTLIQDNKTDVNLQNIDGITALIAAIQSNNIGAVVALLERKDINVMLEDKNGKNALKYALEKNLDASIIQSIRTQLLRNSLNYASEMNFDASIIQSIKTQQLDHYYRQFKDISSRAIDYPGREYQIGQLYEGLENIRSLFDQRPINIQKIVDELERLKGEFKELESKDFVKMKIAEFKMTLLGEYKGDEKSYIKKLIEENTVPLSEIVKGYYEVINKNPKIYLDFDNIIQSAIFDQSNSDTQDYRKALLEYIGGKLKKEEMEIKDDGRLLSNLSNIESKGLDEQKMNVLVDVTKNIDSFSQRRSPGSEELINSMKDMMFKLLKHELSQEDYNFSSLSKMNELISSLVSVANHREVLDYSKPYRTDSILNKIYSVRIDKIYEKLYSSVYRDIATGIDAKSIADGENEIKTEFESFNRFNKNDIKIAINEFKGSLSEEMYLLYNASLIPKFSEDDSDIDPRKLVETAMRSRRVPERLCAELESKIVTKDIEDAIKDFVKFAYNEEKSFNVDELLSQKKYGDIIAKIRLYTNTNPSVVPFSIFEAKPQTTEQQTISPSQSGPRPNSNSSSQDA